MWRRSAPSWMRLPSGTRGRSPKRPRARFRFGRLARALVLLGLAACGLGAIASARDLDPSGGEVERAVGEVFADPALRAGLEERHGGSWAARLYMALVELYWRVTSYLQELQVDSPFLFWTLFAVLVATFVLILVHLGWTFGLAFRRASRPEDQDGEAVSERVHRSGELRRQSRELASRGEFREATRLLLLALLALLEESRTLTIALGWTIREILGRLRVRPEFSGDLRFFERTVEAVCYGGARLDDGQFRRLDGILGEITRNVQSRPPADSRSGGGR